MADKDLKSLRFKGSDDVYHVYDETARQAIDDLEDVVDGKQEELESGVNIKTINGQDILGPGNINVGGGSGGTNDYTQLDNKPQINDVTLTGNKSLADLGIASTDDLEGLATEDYVDQEIAKIDVPPGIADDVAELKAEMAGLIENNTETVDVVAGATEVAGTYIMATGETNTAASWSYYTYPVEDAISVTYKCFQGGQKALPMVAFYSSTVISTDSYLGGDNAGGTIENNYIENTCDVPEGTKMIVVNTKKAEGGVPECTALVGNQGTIPAMQSEINGIIEQLEQLAGKTVKEGLRIAVTGDSISTSTNSRCPEIEVTAEDVGVELAGWLTTYDFNRWGDPFTIGGVSHTSSEVGNYITFVPTAEDIGKSIGNESIYNGVGTKVWWEWFQDLGVETINGTYSSGSLCSHEKTTPRLCTAHGWHDQQIRRLGKRIPGTMRRLAPDIILMYRGCNDMTHSPYALLTNNYFENLNWTYPTDDVVTGGFGFKEACAIWVDKLRTAYPRAQIVFCTQNGWKRINYSKFPVHNGLYTQPQFNKAVREVADFFGCETIDFDKDGITYENMYPTYISDSAQIPTHPNNLGHATMGLKAIKDLDAKLDLFNFTPLKLEGKVKYYVVANLTNAEMTASVNSVYTGGSFTATLAPTGGATLGTVTVTMGGTDVTATAWDSSNSTVTISNVTGEIRISNEPGVAETVNLTQTYTNVTSNQSGDKIAKNQKATILISPADGYLIDESSVVVTMGGTDITANAFQWFGYEAEVIIDNVTDDVTITANATQFSTVYKAKKSQVGISGKLIHTGLYGNSADLRKAIVKFRVNTVATSKSIAGIFADIFCNIGSASSGPATQFQTGGSALTNVAPVANTRYIAVLDGINQNASTLTMYDGYDNAMTTILGQTANRSAASTDVPFCLMGFHGSGREGYSTTNEYFYFCKVYNASNTLTHLYIPVENMTVSGEVGIYDVVGNQFLPFINCDSTLENVNITQTLTHVTSSYTQSTLMKGQPQTIVLHADDGYRIDSVTVLHGITDITSTSFTYYANDAVVALTNPTEDITITATATLVDAGYRIMKEATPPSEPSTAIYGVNTQLGPTQISTATIKLRSIVPMHNKGFGIYGDIFANEYMNSTRDRIEWATGGSIFTGVEVAADTEYNIKLSGVNQTTSTLTIYAGADNEMTNALGSISRDKDPTTVTSKFYLCSFGANNDGDNPNGYSCTNMGLQNCKVYDLSNTLIRHYIPAERLSDNATGVYDLVNSTFYPFTNAATT